MNITVKEVQSLEEEAVIEFLSFALSVLIINHFGNFNRYNNINNNNMNAIKLLLLKQYFLWRIIEENEERFEPDGWFPANKTYKHYLFNAVINFRKGSFERSKQYHIDKFIIWYLKENKRK